MKNWFKMLRDGYLLKMALTAFLFVCVPLLCFAFFVVRGSFQEMKRNTYVSHLENTAGYNDAFEERLSTLQNHALNITFDKKISRVAVEENNFYAKQTANLLKTYKNGIEFADVMGIHFIGTDYVLTSDGFMYSTVYYAGLYAGGDELTAQNIVAFFKNENRDRIHLFSTFDRLTAQQGALFIAIPVSMHMGLTDDAVIYYILRWDSLKNYITDTNAFYIYDGERRPLYVNASRPDVLPVTDEAYAAFLRNPDAAVYEFAADGRQYTVFKRESRPGGFLYVNIVAQPKVERSFEGFYNLLRTVFLITAAMLVLAVAGAMVINYKPIWRLVRRVSEYEGNPGDVTNSIQYITRSWDKLSTERDDALSQLTRQHKTLTYYVFGDILNGQAVPGEEERFLAPDFTNNSVFVLSALAVRLNNKQRTLLEETLLARMGCHVYTIDIPGERHIAFVCVAPRELPREVFLEQFGQVLDESCGGPVRYGCGGPARDMGQLHGSYMESLRTLETTCAPSRSGSIDPGQYAQSDAQVMDFLIHVSRGDAEAAVAKLHALVREVEERFLSSMIRRYVLFNILNRYTDTLRSRNVAPDERHLLDMIQYNDVRQYEALFAASVRRACAEIVCQQSRQRSALHQEILDYVNSRYAQADFSLTTVADHFNMSIYTLSRIFKDISGAGFKEYVVHKKLEESKRLLTTTEKSIKEITGEVGLYNADYFTKLFRNSFGISPSSYRTLIKKQGIVT